ncbi:MAG: hypothetical protein ABSF79_07055 [Smithellaceae bacterium]|jgi:hypothetical protein
MTDESKIFTIADLQEINEFAKFKTGVTVDEMRERTYRKGCHQTAAMIHSAIGELKSKDEIIQFVGALEDVLADIRGDSEPHPGLLDEARQKAFSL